MQTFYSAIVLRHRKENLKKCSLRGLENRPDFAFFTYPNDNLPDLTGYILLTIDAPELTIKDGKSGLVLVDGTWKYAKTMLLQRESAFKNCVHRSLPPSIRTAYPRQQTDCPDPERGLASIEALYSSFRILGREIKGLLKNYYWKQDFLTKNGF